MKLISSTVAALWVLSKDPSKYKKEISDKVDKLLKDAGFKDETLDKLETVQQNCPGTECSACKTTKDSIDVDKVFLIHSSMNKQGLSFYFKPLSA